MRERRLEIIERRDSYGITPARAGKTRLCLRWCSTIEDHPRSCGKDKNGANSSPGCWGSPPLVRERQNRFQRRYHKQRITPARAGKTYRLELVFMPPKDHPRSCGKDIVFTLISVAKLGSPPLVRERHEEPSGKGHPQGITPARAGKTVITHVGNVKYWDHPRSCGKDLFGISLSAARRGSPPLVRERQ